MTLSKTQTHQTTPPHLPAAEAHSYICDMLKELTQIAQEAELKALTALLRVSVTAAETHDQFL